MSTATGRGDSMTTEEREALIEKIVDKMYSLGIRTKEQAKAFIEAALAYDPDDHDQTDE